MLGAMLRFNPEG
jgi:hypothetical protein